jgi:hypothetical protein
MKYKKQKSIAKVDPKDLLLIGRSIFFGLCLTGKVDFGLLEW